jgi:hypothetical protein
MPTYCDNRLVVSGKPDDVQLFVSQVRTDEQPLSFEEISPTPPELMAEGWYEWRIENWGTKWDAGFNFESSSSRITRSKASYVFCTAWGPPLAWLASASKLFPRLTFRLDYADEGDFFSGTKEWRKGELVRNQERVHNQ